jgi:hypothetical protein
MQLDPRSHDDDHAPEPDPHARATNSAPRRRAGTSEAALNAFIGKKAEIDEMLARLQALSDDHFNAHPDEVNWADVGTLEHYTSLLKRITDSAFRRRRSRRLISGTAGTPAARPARLGVVEGAACRGPEYGDDPMTKLSDTQR